MEMLSRLRFDTRLKFTSAPVPRCICNSISNHSITNVTLTGKTEGRTHQLYLDNKNFYEHVPRGLSLLESTEVDSSSTTLLMKGQREIGELLDPPFRMSPQPIKDTVIAVDVDGIPIMFTGLYLDSKFFLVAGTTSVHIIFNCKEHIEMYKENYTTSADVIMAAEAVLGYWNDLNDATRKNLMRNMTTNKHTVVARLIRPNNWGYVHKHDPCTKFYVNSSHPNLVATALVVNTLNSDSLIATEPMRMYNILSTEYHMNVPQYKRISLQNVDPYIQNMNSHAIGVKGWIIHYCSDDGEVRAILSYKSKWHTALDLIKKKSTGRRLFNPQNHEGGVVIAMRSTGLFNEVELLEWGRIILSWFTYKLGTRNRKCRMSFEQEWFNFNKYYDSKGYNGNLLMS